jgi:hypothetical protein
MRRPRGVRAGSCTMPGMKCAAQNAMRRVSRPNPLAYAAPDPSRSPVSRRLGGDRPPRSSMAMWARALDPDRASRHRSPEPAYKP